ncbi:NAD(P)H-dependent oxidoreductase [candidate division WOR-3 bacterium]|nr:NAD(P)H-dependent oxidoreductase [candidate division WOR-3 bacterium]
MKIAVLNGSPKGEMSITMQYVHFIQKKFPQHELDIFNVAQRIKTIRGNDKAFQKIIDLVKSSDGVLWAFPLYVLHVHSGYKRFIELISEKGAEDVFTNKYTAVLTTSIHFFDHTAHNYMNAICDDLDMKYVGGFSAYMDDLLKEKERERLILFAETLFEAIENKTPFSKSYQPVTYRKFDYIPGNVENKIDAGDKKIVILTDSEDNQTNLGRMIERFKNSFANEIEVINLHNINIKGGCLGCVQCSYENICAYGDKDGFMEFYNTRLKPADVLVFAGAIKDRYLSSRWKLFFDRGFFYTHSPSLIGKQIGFIISGSLRQIPNLRQIFEAWTDWQHANLVDFITDEYEDSAEIDALLQSFAQRLIRFADKNYIKPATFLGVGGMKVFRDDIWGRLRFPFQADHRFYKKHGIYDFPQKDFRTRIRNWIMMFLTKIPKIRKEIYTKKLKEGMIKPLQKILED